MSEVKSLLHKALGGEPPLGFGAADVIARARAVRRRRRLATATALVVVSGGLAGLVAGGLVAASPPPAAAMTLGNLTRTSFSGPPGAPAVAVRAESIGTLSTADLPALVTRFSGVGLTSVDVSSQKRWEISLSAGLDVPGAPYLNVQVTRPHVLDPEVSDCTEPGVRDSANPPGITWGACIVRQLAGGVTLTLISGKATAGRFFMAQALLIRPDGSAIFAEDTNQSDAPAAPDASRTGQSPPVFGPYGTAPIVAAAPKLGHWELARIVLLLAGAQ